MPYRIWAIGIYLFTTNIKGISSMKLHRELGIGQKAAWFMLHRLREAYQTAYSGAIRPVIPLTSGHPYRFDPAGDSGASGHPVFT